MSATGRIYLHPRWPSEPFLLQALDGGWALGPFEPQGWGQLEDGTVVWADGSHPVTLRVIGQDGEILHANDGDMGPMDYRVVPESQWQAEQ